MRRAAPGAGAGPSSVAGTIPWRSSPAAGMEPARSAAGWALTQLHAQFFPISAPAMAPPPPPRAGSPQVLLSQPAGARSDPDGPHPAPGQGAQLNTAGKGGRGAQRRARPAAPHGPRPLQPSPCSLRRRAPRPLPEAVPTCRPAAPGPVPLSSGVVSPARPSSSSSRSRPDQDTFLATLAMRGGDDSSAGPAPPLGHVTAATAITWPSGRPGAPRGTMGVVVPGGSRARSH